MNELLILPSKYIVEPLIYFVLLSTIYFVLFSTINLINLPISAGSPIFPDDNFFLYSLIFFTNFFNLFVLNGPGTIFIKKNLFEGYLDNDFIKNTKLLLKEEEISSPEADSLSIDDDLQKKSEKFLEIFLFAK
jgi:hypothetical protein